VTASKSTSGTGTHLARPVFATAPETRQTLPRFVDVAPRQPLKFADPHSGRVEHECRQAVLLRQQTRNGLDVRGGRRVQLAPFLARHLHRQLVSRRVRRDAAVVEHHRQHRDRFADRLLAQAGGV
jgi:hypothetical protein